MNKPKTLEEASKLLKTCSNFPPFFDDPYSNFLIDVAVGLVGKNEWSKLKSLYQEEVEIINSQTK